MTKVDYELFVADPGDGYGVKFALRTEYNKQLVKSIKAMDWELSHRGWDNYENVWRFDINDYTVDELRRLGVDVPDLEICKQAAEAVSSEDSELPDDPFPVKGKLEVFA
ncbi:MAG: hypothetical protein GF309_02360 [Candidatus Lokiarchaeota archaeon]|jgi:hypothetical protein|nr:hypothetical protein [Candidatus Lokiarchaeota archaeon]